MAMSKNVKCTVCDSNDVDVWGDHCICRNCGNEFYLYDRFGYNDNEGDSWNGGNDGFGDVDDDSNDNDSW